MPKVPYPYEINGKLVTGNGSNLLLIKSFLIAKYDCTFENLVPVFQKPVTSPKTGIFRSDSEKLGQVLKLGTKRYDIFPHKGCRALRKNICIPLPSKINLR